MANSYYVGQDDNDWIMDVLCSDVNGPVELGAATEILMYLSTLDGRRPDLVLSATAEPDYAFTNGSFVNPGTSGKNCIARHTGTAVESATPGLYRGRVQATWNDGTVRSFPTTASYFSMNVTLRPS